MRQEKGASEELTTKEVARLIEWLKAKGHTEEDVYDCIDFIAYGQ